MPRVKKSKDTYRGLVINEKEAETLSEVFGVSDPIYDKVYNRMKLFHDEETAARKAAYLKLKKINHECFVGAVENELESVQKFAEHQKSSYMQGDMLASRNPQIVEGDMGKRIIQTIDKAKTI